MRNVKLEECFLDPSVFLVQLLADNVTLNLVRAFIYLQYFGIAHHLFHRVIPHISIASKDLYGVGGYAHGNIGWKEFGHR